jgi:DNA (cytosine-5)-methyltransferase 1
MYTSIDLFSGPGGLATGLMWAGIKPLIAVEWSYWTAQTYSTTHDADLFELERYLSGTMENPEQYFLPSEKTLLIHGDINLVSNELIDRILRERFNTNTVDLVTGGAPCESFSMAGTRTAGDERDDLFLNILRIARHVESKMMLFENVKGLLSKKHEDESIFENICDEFEALDRETSYYLASRNKREVLLTSSHFGVPQNRERVFLVAINRDFQATYTYPQPTHGPDRMNPFVTVGDALLDLPKVGAGEENNEYDFDLETEGALELQREEFLLIMRGMTLEAPEHLAFDRHSLSSHKAVNHRENMIKRMELINQGESMKIAAERLITDGKEEYRVRYFPKKLYGARNRRLRLDRPSFTVTSHCLDEMIHPTEHRGLTPREAARLQSFPDWYQFEGPYVKFHSDPEQDRYEQIGDAIPPLLAYALAKEIKVTLEQIYEQIPTNENELQEIPVE